MMLLWNGGHRNIIDERRDDSAEPADCDDELFHVILSLTYSYVVT